MDNAIISVCTRKALGTPMDGIPSTPRMNKAVSYTHNNCGRSIINIKCKLPKNACPYHAQSPISEPCNSAHHHLQLLTKDDHHMMRSQCTRLTNRNFCNGSATQNGICKSLANLVQAIDFLGLLGCQKWQKFIVSHS